MTGTTEYQVRKLLGRAKRLVTAAERLVRDSTDPGVSAEAVKSRASAIQGAAAAARAALAHTETLAKLTGEARPEVQVAVVTEDVLEASQAWIALRARILQELGHWPEARRAVLAAIAGPSRGFDPDRAYASPSGGLDLRRG